MIPPKLLLRFDDIAENMNWHYMDKCEKLFDEYNIKPTLGVIPENLDKELKKLPLNNNFWKKVKTWQSKGWEISMHGYDHLYKRNTYKKDYFGYGGLSEFFGETLENQSHKIRLGLKKFSEKDIKIRSFFAPNHTYDLNTFKSIEENKIKYVIDGYGLSPYKKFNLVFIPQLFYKIKILPIGYQSTQIHLNFWTDKNMLEFEDFIKKNHKFIISFEELIKILSQKKNYMSLSLPTEIILKSIRKMRKFF